MIVTRKVRLTAPILASRPATSSDGRRTFDRLKSTNDVVIRIKTYLDRWNWAFLEARDALDFEDVCVAAIIPAPYFETSRTSTYVRRQSGSRNNESFECIPSGSVLEWRFTLSNQLPPHTDHPRYSRAPTEEEFDAMLKHIGENLGMSFWGHGFLFGTFELHFQHKIKENEK
jgi:hypothetical protein